MHELNVNRRDENKKQIGQSVKPEGERLIRKKRYLGYIKVNQGAEATDTGKEDVGGVFLSLKNGEKRQKGKDKKTG